MVSKAPEHSNGWLLVAPKKVLRVIVTGISLSLLLVISPLLPISARTQTSWMSIRPQVAFAYAGPSVKHVQYAAGVVQPDTSAPDTMPPVQPPTKADPWRLQIPAIGLATSVISAELTKEASPNEMPVYTWTVPDFSAVGWHVTSAQPGEPGNTVLNGHNNILGSVFRYLDDARPGDQVILNANGERYAYVITTRRIVQEAGASLATRIANARWVAPTEDERLTLVTCWPPSGNSHRLIVIARPFAPAYRLISTRPAMR